jgi:hypothetical protein
MLPKVVFAVVPCVSIRARVPVVSFATIPLNINATTISIITVIRMFLILAPPFMTEVLDNLRIQCIEQLASLLDPGI